MNSQSASQPLNVLVTGAPGFIGRRVVERFLTNGANIVSLSLPGELAQPHWSGRVRMIYGDVCNPSDVADAASGVDIIIHLAAPVGLAGEYERQWSIIAEGTRNMCRAAPAKARILVASSIAIYGDHIQTKICAEDVGFGAWQGAYGRAKQAQETIAQEECAKRGLPLTLIRPANVYGLGGASAWGDRLIEAFKHTGGAVIGNAEHNNAGLVYVENLADAIVLAATKTRAIGRVYNVCDDETVTWRRFLNDMAALAGVASPPLLALEPLLEAARANEDPASLQGPSDPLIPGLEGLNLVGFDNRFPSARIQRDLGWKPRISYVQAMAAMADQMRGAPPS